MRYRRIIPARAGFTRTAPAWWSSVGDHPRSRGVYRSAIDVRGDLRGSSPLARGLRVHHVLVCCSARIIPARAGFTLDHFQSPPPLTDHPRSRGVYDGLPASIRAECGSSPLARGLLRSRVTCWGRGWDHPRSRGVYVGLPAGLLRWMGSSPLARGLLLPGPRHRPGPGIIPARAGFTRSGGPSARRPQDHPRSRGVYSRSGLSRWL